MTVPWGWATTTDEVLTGVSLDGKVAVVTGATTGLGRETARALAAHGARVVITGRTREKAGESLAGLGDGISGEAVGLELGSLDSVLAATDEILERHPRIDILIANAGIMACPLGRTAEGFELQFGTNHLGHFLFTGRLLPAVIAARGRIVNLSSGGHRISGIHWDDPNYRERRYEKWEAYGQSKTANILHALELQRRLGANGVLAFSVHPGVIGTELSRHLSGDDLRALRDRSREVANRRKPVEAGAATSVWAATAPELAGHGGSYLEDCGIATPAAHAADPDSATRLWALSEELVGETIIA
jgi:NAD(P)-dependent dehydrogenase (short-subunit alcohol dehydrogenase family)